MPEQRKSMEIILQAKHAIHHTELNPWQFKDRALVCHPAYNHTRCQKNLSLENQLQKRGFRDTVQRKPYHEVLFSSSIITVIFLQLKREISTSPGHDMTYPSLEAKGQGVSHIALALLREGRARQRDPECGQGPQKGVNVSAKETARCEAPSVNTIFVP